ncbi:hypothetical protein BDZ91DRAFT_782995 [Kalaharituber pfeilii]|nr:hypothetical protein BDZ91DRAFT_782995 [Kalaharituber pfeilii]
MGAHVTIEVREAIREASGELKKQLDDIVRSINSVAKATTNNPFPKQQFLERHFESIAAGIHKLTTATTKSANANQQNLQKQLDGIVNGLQKLTTATTNSANANEQNLQKQLDGIVKGLQKLTTAMSKSADAGQAVQQYMERIARTIEGSASGTCKIDIPIDNIGEQVRVILAEIGGRLSWDGDKLLAHLVACIFLIALLCYAYMRPKMQDKTGIWCLLFVCLILWISIMLGFGVASFFTLVIGVGFIALIFEEQAEDNRTLKRESCN